MFKKITISILKTDGERHEKIVAVDIKKMPESEQDYNEIARQIFEVERQDETMEDLEIVKIEEI